MPTYVLPQALVFQDFTVTPQTQANIMRAHITGGHAQLVRFNDADEQALGELGAYDWLSDTAYTIPNREAGAVVDATYTQLFAKNAILRYFTDNVNFTRTGTNKVGGAAINLATGDDGSSRDADLYDRDVAVGDTVKARFVPVGGDPVTLWTYVAALEADPVASSIDAATADAANGATTGGAAATVSQIDGPTNAIEATSPSAAAYLPYITGQISETYTIIVTQASVNNDFTTARLRVISASGLDDAEDVTPSAEGVATAIGAQGATLTFDDTGGDAASDSASIAGISPNNFLVGQRWRLNVTATFTATTGTSGGTYTGDTDTTYVVEVVRGGVFDVVPYPQIKITTTTGVDISGPLNATSASVAYAVGTRGVTVTFTASAGLALGDRFYIPAVAEANGPVRTIVLGHTIDSTIVDGDACELTLYILKPTLEITKNRIGFAPQVNYELSETQITVNSSVIAYDETWTDGGTPLALPLEADATQEFGVLYVQYRAWLQDLCHEVGTISDVGTLDDQISGSLTPDNPLKWGVFKALSNSNGAEVKFTSVCDPDDSDSWAEVLELLLGRDDVHGLVPLTRNRTVLDLWAAHADGRSTPEAGLWRTCWFNLAGIPEIPVVAVSSTVPGHTEATTTDEGTCLAIIEDDPDATDTQYTLLTVPAANGQFITNGVRAGDIVRAQYTGNGFGDYTYTEFVVDKVITEDSVRLVTGPASSVSVASKIEIWRNLTATEEAAAIALVAGSWGTRRIKSLWPDQIETSGTVQEGYFLAAACAGLASGVHPHQGLTNLEISGFTSVPRTTSKFNKPQLDQMAIAGVWIVTQDGIDGLIYTRHAVTTGSYEDINMREEMITRNVDSISYRFKDHFKPFIGVSNVTPAIISMLRMEVLNLVEVLKTEKETRLLGGQLVEAEILELHPHLILKDRIVLILDTTVPAPFNNFEIHLVI